MKKKRAFVLPLYALGYLGIAIFTQTTVKWYQYFYAPPQAESGGMALLVPVGFVGIAMVIARLFDGAADPLVAYFSDRSKHPMGRRRPFILFGSLPLTACFVLLWFPPVAGESVVNFVYLTVMLSLFFIFFTVVTGPYLALIGEVTATRKERIRLTMMQGVAQIVGVMAAEAGSGVLIESHGFKVMGIVLGGVALAAILLTPLVIEEREGRAVAPSVNLSDSIKMTMQNNHFVYYMASSVTIWFGINSLTIAMPYIAEVLLGASAAESGYFIAGAFIVALLFSPVLPRFTLKYGKKRVMVAASGLFALILCLTGLFGTVLPYGAAFVVILLAGVPLAAVFVVQNAMVADVAELDGIEQGTRREGMFFGAQGLLLKIGIGLSSLFTPFLFSTFGYSPDGALGLQLIGPMTGVIVLAGIPFLLRYGVDETALAERRDMTR